jgi:hypothetical protein
MGSLARRCRRPSSGLRRRTVHPRSSGRGRRRRVMEAPDPGVAEAAVMRSPPGRNASLRVDSSPTSPDGSWP